MPRFQRFLLLLLVLALPVLAAGAAFEVLVVGEDGRPLAGATVRLIGPDGSTVAETVTAADGRATFAGLPSGSYDVEVLRGGVRVALRHGVAIAAGRRADARIALSPTPPPPPVEEPQPAAVEELREALPLRKRMDAKLGRAQVAQLSALGYVAVGDAADREFNTESYDFVEESGFRPVATAPLSTFSIDVDTASYANVRRFLTQGQLPPHGAVRIEELINYFDYDYAQPTGDLPFGIDVEVADAPWQPRHRLVRIGLKGREIPPAARPASNLVFLLDVSGSMSAPNKLALVQRAMRLLVDELNARDRVAIAVYAGAAGLVLPPTPATDRDAILGAIERLSAGGSTAGGAGIRLAYKTAREAFIPGGVNRVMLATDGDFNVGVTDQGSLVELVRREAESGVFLTVLGFGMGNYKDSTLEKLADRGNGNYAYIDSLAEARKVLVEEAGGTLVTIAKDVKIQVEFNPAEVAAYRLIGYENRALRDEDFNDDRKDAGEIGAGHTVTALYEIVPPGADGGLPSVDPLKYRRPAAGSAASESGELLTVKVRFKDPDGDASRLQTLAVADAGKSLAAAGDDFRFAAAVAGFGMALRESEHRAAWTIEDSLELARGSLGRDPNGHRGGFLTLAEQARRIPR